ncbi:MAG: sugar transferase [Gemmataceae bacterium]|nr:sugar transferase [Gemmataceae bacterium]
MSSNQGFCLNVEATESILLDSRPLSGGMGWYGPIKEAIDFVLAVLLLALAGPAMLLAGLLMKLTSQGPMFYSQVRLGRGGRPFWIYKVRTMIDGCEGRSGPCWSGPGDARVTPFGRFLRRTHIDELPQLWNVLRGDMALIGPRPERPEFVWGLERALPRYRERLQVRPGISGLAQVQLPPDTDLESVRQKLAYDLLYVERCSLWLDGRILLGTACALFNLPFGVARTVFQLPAPASDAPLQETQTSEEMNTFRCNFPAVLREATSA